MESEGSKEQWVVSGIGISNSGSSHVFCTARVQPLDKPLDLQKEGVEVTPEEPSRATGLVMYLLSFSSPNSLFLENRKMFMEKQFRKQSTMMGKEPGGQMRKESQQIFRQNPDILRNKILPFFPDWMERGKWSRGPSFLGFGLWFLFIPYWRRQMSPELRDCCPC